MRGHEQIVRDRLRGFRPAGLVSVETGQLPDSDDSHEWAGKPLIYDWPGQTPIAIQPCVVLDPGEAPHRADWRWTRGLKIWVRGDNHDRVRATFEAIRGAGAEYVFASALNETEFVIFDSRKGD